MSILKISLFSIFFLANILNAAAQAGMLTKTDCPEEDLTVKEHDVFYSPYSEATAIEDIETDSIQILFLGGISGIVFTEEDLAFQEKYGIQFKTQGCIHFSIKGEAAYNQQIFAYLDTTYGTIWRKELREDAIGF